VTVCQRTIHAGVERLLKDQALRLSRFRSLAASVELSLRAPCPARRSQIYIGKIFSIVQVNASNSMLAFVDSILVCVCCKVVSARR
jgi:hypothetical protein